MYTEFCEPNRTFVVVLRSFFKCRRAATASICSLKIQKATLMMDFRSRLQSNPERFIWFCWNSIKLPIAYLIPWYNCHADFTFFLQLIFCLVDASKTLNRWMTEIPNRYVFFLLKNFFRLAANETHTYTYLSMQSKAVLCLLFERM